MSYIVDLEISFKFDKAQDYRFKWAGDASMLITKLDTITFVPLDMLSEDIDKHRLTIEQAILAMLVKLSPNKLLK